MGDKKTVFKFFTIFQYRQEEAFLSSMHGKGWKLTGITFPGFYRFESCEPQNVAYRLDYNQEGINDKKDYVQIFSDCGWDYLFDFVGYSYFRKAGADSQEQEEIFCDDASRLDMMKRVFRGRMIPLIILFVCVILPQLFMNISGHGTGGSVQDFLSITFLVLAIIYLVIFGATSFQFYQYEKKLFPENPGIKWKYLGISLLIFLVIISIGIFLYFSRRSVYSVSETADGFTIEAEQLNKPVLMEYNLKKGDLIAVSHQYDGGELSIRIEDGHESPVFYGNSYDGFGDFTVEIQEDGHYRIECTGRRAKGVIRFVIKQHHALGIVL